eukprot:5061128-Pyramimonas_sp.AAC.1
MRMPLLPFATCRTPRPCTLARESEAPRPAPPGSCRTRPTGPSPPAASKASAVAAWSRAPS